MRVGDELVEHPAVRRLNFTGSTATGRKLAEAAGRNLKRIVLELGGHNPLLVLADADLDYAAIGQALGICPGTVAATLNAAHTALRSRLEVRT